MTITDELPTFIDVFGMSRTYEVVAFTSNSQLSGVEFPDRIEWTATNLVAGDTGALTLVLQVPNGITPAAGDTIVNTAAFDSNGVIVESSPATTEVQGAEPGIVVTKSNNRSQILAGATSTYTIKVCPQSGMGHFPDGYTITDTVPAGAVVVGPIADGGIESPSGTVSWTITNSDDPGFDPSTGCFSRQLRVNYPADLFAAGASVTNNVSVDVGTGEPVGPIGDTDTIRAPEPGMAVGKSADAGTYVTDEDPVNYSLTMSNADADGGSGETTLSNVVLLDGPLPVGFELTSVKPGEWPDDEVATIEVSSAGASGPWTVLGTADGSAAQNVALIVPSSVANASNGTDRFVRWTFAGPVSKGFSLSSAAQLSGSVEEDPFLSAPGLPQTVTNCLNASADGDVNGTLVPLTRGPYCAALTLEEAQPNGLIDKNVDPGILQPGETGTFTLVAGNDPDATGPMVIDVSQPTRLEDCVPKFLLVDSITLNGWTDLSPGGLSCDPEETPLVLEYRAATTLLAGQNLPSVLVGFHVSELGDPLGAAPPGQVTNSAQFSQSSVLHCAQTECSDAAAVVIPVSSTLKSRKQVAGFYDDPLTGPPVPYTNPTVDVSADTYPGGPIDYRIGVLNNGNADVKNFTIIDVLPDLGDTGVKVGMQQRYTQFRPMLDQLVVPPTGWQVEYSTSSNPCRDELSPLGVNGCEAPNWTATPGDLSAVGSFRLTLIGTGGAFDAEISGVQTDDDVFERGEEVVVDFHMVAPLFHELFDTDGTTAYPWENLNPPTQVDLDPSSQDACNDLNNSGDDPTASVDRCPVARNSFAYAGTAFSVDGLFGDVGLGSEPPRVDVTVYSPPNNAVGDVVWFDVNANGIQDAGEAGVPNVVVELYDAAGEPVLDDNGDPLTTTTDANGNYIFVNLVNGDYRIRFYPPAGYVVSPNDQSGDPSGIDEGGTSLDGSPNSNDDSDAPVPPVSQDYTETELIHLEKQGDAGEYDPTWDLGIYREVYSLGNTVWIDNGAGGGGFDDGIRDSGEAVVPGVTVTLYAADVDGNPTGSVLATDVTDADGRYRFDTLEPGTYVVVIGAANFADGSALDETRSSTGSTPSVDSADVDNLDHGIDGFATSGVAAGGIVSEPVTLGAGLQPTSDADPTTNPQAGESPNWMSNRTVDFGFVPLVSVGDVVWYDADRDGTFDVTESGLADVTVTLLDGNGVAVTVDALGQPIVPITTDVNGRYSFDSLETGDYRIEFTLPNGYEWTTANVGNDSLDSDALFTSITDATASTATFTLADAVADGDSSVTVRSVTDPTRDAGVWLPFAVGDIVWYDLDKDGTQSAAPVEGALVELLQFDSVTSTYVPARDADGNLVGSQTTGADGTYLFDYLLPGTYKVQFTHQQAGYNWTLADTGAGADASDSDATYTVASQDVAQTTPFTLSQLATQVRATTAADDTTYGTTVRAAYIDPTRDVGIFAPLAVGNYVWFDADKDGLQGDPLAEAPIEGVVVKLYRLDDTLVATTSTDAAGYYQFDGLGAGDYYVEFERPAGMLFTDALAGDDATDSNADAATGRSETFTLDASLPLVDAGGQEPADINAVRVLRTIDAGFISTYTLGNLVWEDLDDDGVAEPGEIPLEGVQITLLMADPDVPASYIPARDADGQPVAVVITDEFGKYLFTNLSAGTYVVSIAADQPALDGLRGAGTPVADADSQIDNDNNGVLQLDGSWLSGAVVIGTGGDEPTDEVSGLDATQSDEDDSIDDDQGDWTVDFGFFRGIRIGNLVWLDGVPGDGATFDNGIVDVGETPIAGATVQLWIDGDGDGLFDSALDTLVDSTVTDTDGNYWFEHLVPGEDYFVAIATVDTPLEARSSTGQSADPSAADNDDDGAPVGTYLVVSSLITAPMPGAAPIAETDAIPVLDGSAETEANDATADYVDGNSDLHIDLGFVEIPLYRIGNLVWFDANKNGLADVGEEPLAGVAVQLFKGATLVAETTTDANGKYLFENLLAGDYEIRIPSDDAMLVGFFSTIDEAADGGIDSQDNGSLSPDSSYWTSGVVALGDGDFADEPTNEFDALNGTADDDLASALIADDRADLTIDFGFYQPRFAVGNEVWYDLDDSGVLDNGELYVADGVIVNLLDADGNVVATTTTLDGRYLFDNLLVGDYMVELDAANFADGGLLAGYRSSTEQTATDDAATDGSDHGDDTEIDGVRSALFSLAEDSEPAAEDPNETTLAPDANANMVLDFGVVPAFAIGNQLWIDLDDSGLIDKGEASVPDGVIVNLLDADGIVVATTTTLDGTYLFDELLAGTYTVEIDAANFIDGGLLDGYRSSTLDAGDDGVDLNDNGAAATNGDGDFVIRSTPIVLGGAGAEVTGEDPTSTTVAADDNAELTVDFGLVPEFSIGNEVWYDLDDSGVLDNGEAYVPNGVIVNLLDADGNVLATTSTVDGMYLFDGLLAGDYVAELDAANFLPGGLLAGAVSSTSSAGDTAVDQDDNGSATTNGDGANVIRSSVITLALNAEPTAESPDNDPLTLDSNENLMVDFGIVPLFSIGNELWFDVNDNGLMDADEAYAPSGVVVNLLDADGNVLAMTTTVDGLYLFDALVAGEYMVEVAASNFAEGAVLEGFRSSSPTAAENAIDRDDNGAPILIAEPFTSGLRSAVFALSLAAEPAAESPDNDALTVDGNENLTVDFGLHRPPFSLGNTVWYDLNDNGRFDAGEAVVADGTIVRLYNEDGVFIAETTTVGGLYLFSDLYRGEYYVEIDRPSGYRSSTPTESGDVDNADHGTDAVNGEVNVVRSVTVMLDEGTEPLVESPDNDGQTGDGNENLTVDLGLVPTLSLGNEVWFDVNDNGVIDDGESYVPNGVIVNLLDADGNVLDITTTVDGLYLFDELLVGNYIIEIDSANFGADGLLTNWVSSTGQTIVDTDRSDHGAPVAGGAIRSGVISLTHGGEPLAENPDNDAITQDANENLTVDFGLTRIALGNYVWLDIDLDGIRDTDEPGVGGVKVELWAANAEGVIGYDAGSRGYHRCAGLLPVRRIDPRQLRGARSDDGVLRRIATERLHLDRR